MGVFEHHTLWQIRRTPHLGINRISRGRNLSGIVDERPLVLLPFLDRGPSRKLSARRLWLGIVGGGAVVGFALTVLAVGQDKSDPQIAQQKVRAQREAQRAIFLAAEGVPATGAAHMMASDPLTVGERIFVRECVSCHPFEDHRPEEIKGPELTGYGTRAWIRQVLRDPDSPRPFRSE